MKMRMFEIIELSNLYGSIKDDKMPLKTVYKFATLMRQLDTELKFFISLNLQKLSKNMDRKDEQGGYVLTKRRFDCYFTRKRK